jgi:hypothetical protein
MRVIRTVLPTTYLMFCALLVFAAAAGNATVFYCLAILSVAGLVRERSAWLASMPVSDRQRLLPIVLPAVATAVACREVDWLLHPPAPARHAGLFPHLRLWLIDATVIAALGVMLLILAEVGGRLSRGRVGRSALLLRGLPILPMAALLIADVVRRYQGEEGSIAWATHGLHGIAERSAVHAWSLLVLAAMLLVTAYVLLEHEFRRSGTSAGAGVSAA